jgi:hypothetical protein
MLSLSVPCRLTLDSLLQKPKAILMRMMMILGSAGDERMMEPRYYGGGGRELFVCTHSDVILPLLHMIPSQLPLQGSPDHDQVDG